MTIDEGFTLLLPVFEISHACDLVFPEFEDLFNSMLSVLRLREPLSRCYAHAWRRAGPRGSWTKEYRRRNRKWNGSFAQEEEE